MIYLQNINKSNLDRSSRSVIDGYRAKFQLSNLNLQALKQYLLDAQSSLQDLRDIMDNQTILMHEQVEEAKEEAKEKCGESQADYQAIEDALDGIDDALDDVEDDLDDAEEDIENQLECLEACYGSCQTGQNICTSNCEVNGLDICTTECQMYGVRCSSLRITSYRHLSPGSMPQPPVQR